MAITKETVHRYECDGCGKIQLGEVTEDVHGLVGTVVEYTPRGGAAAEWFACCPQCIATAIRNALTRAYEH